MDILKPDTFEEIFDKDEISEWDDYSSTFPWRIKDEKERI